MAKHKKKSKKSKKDKKYSSSSSSESEYEWVEAKSNANHQEENRSKNKPDVSRIEASAGNCNQRDDWMSLPTLFTSSSTTDRQEKRRKDKKEKADSEKYNPSQSVRELNPYWKGGGDGLPKFAKPKYDSDEESSSYTSRNRTKIESSWRKKRVDRDNRRDYSPRESRPHKHRKHDNSSDEHAPVEDSRTEHSSKEEKVKYQSKEEEHTAESDSNSSKITVDSNLLSEKELNLLAGKLVKAEIMGNAKLAEQLKAKLENARKNVEQAKMNGSYEEVLLTHTDSKGQSQPVKFKSECAESSSGRKQKKIKTETHNKNNERVRYFADDDKYSLKQMFEEEKYGDSHHQDKVFMELAGKVKKNDDLDDLFTDEVRRTKSDSKIDASERDKAIREHQQVTKALDNCDKCIQSEASSKHLIVSMGEYVYLALPSREPLTEGHCYIVPIRHVSCSTALDENEWSEILDFRKALFKYFQTKHEEPIFFECAMYFYKQPHMIVECIPVSQEDNMAPIYFKKAIDESETEWAQNKKLVSLKGRDVRKAIPKGLPYFFVSFGLEEGFAHVIEDEKMFPKNFAQEIIGGMLDLHHNKWRNPQRQSFADQSKRVLNFSNEWKNFDCTNKT